MRSIKSHFLFLTKKILTIIILCSSVNAYSQVTGCKDSMANNYNSSATVNDGSCTYDVTSYTPPIQTDSLNAILFESSGLQMAANFLWSFNDGGGAAAIYRIDTLSNKILQTVNLDSAANVDWEEMSFDGTYFYVGDFGNNTNGARTDLKIYKFPLSAIPDYNTDTAVTIPASLIEIINYTYGDQPQPPVAADPNYTKFDCEAMNIDNGQIHLFTKNWVDQNTVHYVINNLTAGTYVATPVDTLATNYLVTAASKAPNQNLTVLLGYQASGLGNHYMHILSDYSGGKFFNGNTRKIDLPNGTVMGKAEGITFRDAAYGYISNEQVLSIYQKLRSFNISDLVPLYVLPLTLKNFTVNTINDSHKIEWVFTDPVQNLQVQHSTDGISFNVLKSYTNTRSDVYYNRSSGPVAYYRISWHTNNGPVKYSSVISIKNKQQLNIGNFILTSNGELSFLLKGNSAAKYSFKLLSSDGKVLAKIKNQLYLPGRNTIGISVKPLINSFVYLSVFGDKHQTTTSVHVEK